MDYNLHGHGSKVILLLSFEEKAGSRRSCFTLSSWHAITDYHEKSLRSASFAYYTLALITASQSTRPVAILQNDVCGIYTLRYIICSKICHALVAIITGQSTQGFLHQTRQMVPLWILVCAMGCNFSFYSTGKCVLSFATERLHCLWQGNGRKMCLLFQLIQGWKWSHHQDLMK